MCVGNKTVCVQLTCISVSVSVCVCMCATYADPGVFESLCGSDAFTGVDG